jgi:RNA 2',3'-cyclic 3'-phosphodiesterase
VKNQPELWRVFCAIEIPKDVRARVVDYIAKQRASTPEARATWARDEGLHITLKFLGDVERGRVPSLTKAAEKAAQVVRPFLVALDGTGTFPVRGAPRVLWIGVADPSGSLASLQNAFEHECESVGFDREKRAFHPHLTIARQRAPKGTRTAAVLQCEPQFPHVQFDVNEIVLIRSELRPEGSRYTTLSRYGLQT